MSLLERKSKKGSDLIQTPDWPTELLLKFLEANSPIWSKNMTIWEPACGEGFMLDCFKANGYHAHGSDILFDHNFLEDKATNQFDTIITNPPFSIKDKFLARCYELKVPFALLLPLTALEGKKRQEMYKRYGLQLLCLPKRVNFKVPSGKNNNWFHCDFFTNGFELEKDLYFLE